ncbi:kinesin-1 heavy chain-like [Styela clava]
MLSGSFSLSHDIDGELRLSRVSLATFFGSEVFQGKPICIISIAGTAKTGKSFLLNFFQRYFDSKGWENPDWIGDEETAAVGGFDWKSGKYDGTKGINVWGKPYVVKRSDGQEVAVVLMDTQGLVENKSHNVKLFTLSAIASSIQILNLKDLIQENDMDILEYCAELGRLSSRRNCNKDLQLQSLLMLVRDWINDDEHPYGLSGGESYLNAKDAGSKVNKVKNQLCEAFKDFNCFLLPHPGVTVLRAHKLNGKNKELEADFLDEIKNFCESLLHPDKLVIKMSGSKPMTSQKFVNLMMAFDEMISGKELPSAEILIEQLPEAINDKYEKALEQLSSRCQMLESERDELKDKLVKREQEPSDEDDKINELTQLTEKMKQRMLEQEEFIMQIREDFEIVEEEMTRLQSEKDEAEKRAQDVSQTLEKLAVNYDGKVQLLEFKSKEVNQLSEEMAEKNKKIVEFETKVSQLQKMSEHHKRTAEMVNSLLKDLGEIGDAVGNKDHQIPDSTSENFFEEFTMTRLFVSKIKWEVKQLATRCQTLESTQDDSNKKCEENEHKLAACQLLISQHEAKIRSLTEYMNEVENKKRSLEDAVDCLNDEIGILRAYESIGEKESQLQESSTLKQLSETHRELVGQLRDEIDKKTKCIEKVKDDYQKLEIKNKQLQQNFEKLKKDEKDKELEDLHIQFDRREQAKQDFKGLEETVRKELTTLHKLRKMFVQDLHNRLEKQQRGDTIEELEGSIAQKQRISFLESNLDQLGKVHKQLICDNADLRCELPKLEKRLRATAERVKSLETVLRDAKEGAMRDRKRYQREVARIKNAVRAKNMQRRKHAAEIVKPVRPVLWSSSYKIKTNEDAKSTKAIQEQQNGIKKINRDELQCNSSAAEDSSLSQNLSDGNKE